MKIAVLGCGPAGLLAAHAAVLAGHNPDVLSVYRPSPIGGAQYLHRAIPGITSTVPDGKVRFLKTGTREGYAQKVYGDMHARTSWEQYEGDHDIWNMRRAYAALWWMYEGLVKDFKVDHVELRQLLDSYDKIFSTVPLKALCYQGHEFASQDVWITTERWCDEGQILMSGEGWVPYYRASTIFGHASAEYSYDRGSDAVKVTKPLRNTCTCFPEVTMLGRYGQWRKEILIHHAFEGALKELS